MIIFISLISLTVNTNGKSTNIYPSGSKACQLIMMTPSNGTFSLCLPLVRAIHQWRRALLFSLICAWTNGWANNRYAGDLTHHRAHYDVVVMCVNVCYQSTAKLNLARLHTWFFGYTQYELMIITIQYGVVITQSVFSKLLTKDTP